MAGGADTPGQGGIEQRPPGLGFPPAMGTIGGLDTESEQRSDEPASSPAGDESA
jgi:hypothetical protein